MAGEIPGFIKCDQHSRLIEQLELDSGDSEGEPHVFKRFECNGECGLMRFQLFELILYRSA